MVGNSSFSLAEERASLRNLWNFHFFSMNLRSTDEIDDHITGCIHFLVKKQEAIFYTLKAFQNTCVKQITHILSNSNIEVHGWAFFQNEYLMSN